MNPISVYGYHPEMLESQNAVVPAQESTQRPLEVHEGPSWRYPSNIYHLLKLPYEIRMQIYGFIMPTTVCKPILGITWRRAMAPIWCTSRKVYNECIGMLYSDCTFDVDVKFDGITFHYQYSSYQKLTSRRSFTFPDIIPARNLYLLRRIHVRVHQLDGYMGMIKHNCSNITGLALGVGAQMQKLCAVLRTLPEIRELQITYSGHSVESGRLMPIIMEPLRILRNTKAVEFIAFEAFDQTYVNGLLNHLNNAYIRNSILNLPWEIRAEIYRHLLPYSTCTMVDGIKEVVWHTGDTSIMRTCRSIYEETNHLLYGLSIFEFTWMLS